VRYCSRQCQPRARDDRRLALARAKRSPRRFGATVTLDCATQLPVPATKAWKRASEHVLKLALAIERISSVEIVTILVVVAVPAWVVLVIWVWRTERGPRAPQLARTWRR
jgi:hypothetical protein